MPCVGLLRPSAEPVYCVDLPPRFPTEPAFWALPAYFACPSFGSPIPGANGKDIPHFSHVFAPGSLSNPHAGQ